MKDKILVIGASGQIGSELIIELRENYGSENVIASDIKIPDYEVMEGGPFELLDILDKKQLENVLVKYGVTQVYLLAALLSATAEQHPEAAWKLNMEGLLNLQPAWLVLGAPGALLVVLFHWLRRRRL